MPCSDERPGDREFEQHMRQGSGFLCEMLKGAEEAGTLIHYPEVLQMWWKEHKIWDLARGH